MRPAALLLVAGLTAVLGVAIASGSASGVGKKRLSGRGFATSVTVAFTAPQGYTIDGGGYENWDGPLFSSLTTGSNDLESGLHFDVHPDFTTRSAQKAAQSKVGDDQGGLPSEQVAAGPIAIPHVVGGKKVGDIKGYYVIRQVTRDHYEGWYEAALGIPLATGYPVLAADVDTTAPADDADKRIEGTLPSAWNRRVVEEGIRGIAVEGNFAPKALVVSATGRRLGGRVRDSLGHPVVAAAVTLKHGGKTCCRTVTSTAGTFSLPVPKSAGTGSFQLSVSTGGATLTKTVRLG
jgi:hypothetical protein